MVESEFNLIWKEVVEQKKQGQLDEADEHLREALKILKKAGDRAYLCEVQRSLAEVRIEQGRIEEAETVYAEDLGYDQSIPRSSWHPGNVWSLHGYHECLVRLGKAEPARIVKQQLDVALARADVPIKSSCFCRMMHHAAAA
jgi:tetratricopeptide (TPR) repeat protein